MISDPKPKSKVRKFVGWGSALSGTAALGYIEGMGAGQVLTDQIVRSIKGGNIAQALILFGIFVLIWLEVHGLKNAVVKMNETIATGFSAGELRFSTIEAKAVADQDLILKLTERITALENVQGRTI